MLDPSPEVGVAPCPMRLKHQPIGKDAYGTDDKQSLSMHMDFKPVLYQYSSWHMELCPITVLSASRLYMSD